MNVQVHPSRLQGVVEAPPSKSCFQRACAAAWIRGGRSILVNPGRSEDDAVAKQVIRDLGAVLEEKQGELHIFAGRKTNPSLVHCGESGLSARMFIPLLALSEKPVRVEGRGSLLLRPLDFFDQVLPRLSVELHSSNGFLPLELRGPLRPADISINGSQSSQYLTGLIMAYVAAGARRKTLRVEALRSRPYVDLTLSVMEKFGLPVPVNNNYESFYFDAAIPEPATGELRFTVEADWSSGAMLLVAGALNGPLRVRGLDLLSAQADRAILDLLMETQAAVAVDAKGITIRPAEMKAFSFDATDCPDLFPPLVALATRCSGRSFIRGAGRLRFKESDRALALQTEFSKMGVSIGMEGDGMWIEGVARLRAGAFDSHGDHRIAMALTLSALNADGPSVIGQADAVRKSYPDFYSHLHSLGASITLQQ